VDPRTGSDVSFFKGEKFFASVQNQTPDHPAYSLVTTDNKCMDLLIHFSFEGLL
jgi:hypothetical protein